MSDTPLALQAQGRTQFVKAVSLGLWAVVCLHAVVLLLVRPTPLPLSRCLTAAIPILAGIACIWRVRRLLPRERPVWLWSSAGLFLWAIAHVAEIMFGNSMAASSLTVDASDFIYLAGTFPLLIALSTTRETESLRAVFALNLGQILLALVLSYALLYRMSLTPHAASMDVSFARRKHIRFTTMITPNTSTPFAMNSTDVIPISISLGAMACTNTTIRITP